MLGYPAWSATWPWAKVAGGQPTGSVNPLVDDHIVGSIALVVLAIFATTSAGYLGRRWSNLGIVKRLRWLR